MPSGCRQKCCGRHLVAKASTSGTIWCFLTLDFLSAGFPSLPNTRAYFPSLIDMFGHKTCSGLPVPMFGPRNMHAHHIYPPVFLQGSYELHLDNC